jgi:two-component system, chemotaxis family, protein-glutamate methylesterase/glutaminase
MSNPSTRIVAIGASTGGTSALETVLSALPPTAPGIVVVQHMPARFTAAFAARLNCLGPLEVREAKPGDRVYPGLALIAPGGLHMTITQIRGQYAVHVFDGPLVNRFRPSVDVLFHSVAHTAGHNALGIMLTGMGDDGVAGLLEMRRLGARTLGQNEETCVVYGMPKEAYRRGAVEREVPLQSMAMEITFYGRAVANRPPIVGACRT